jgi:hypothetical protein
MYVEYNTEDMNDRKLKGESFDDPVFVELTKKKARQAEISEDGRARAIAAMQEAVNRIERKYALSYGVGGTHVDELLHYIDEKIRGLYPKEKDFTDSFLREYYNAPETEVEEER